MFVVDIAGMVQHPRVHAARRLAIEKTAMDAVHGIIVHQTGGATAQSALDSYLQQGANGAHLLVDKDGSIFQTASLRSQTWHVGNLKSRCLAESRCTPVELSLLRRFDPRGEHQREQQKQVPDRYPANTDSVGIELVGMAKPDPAGRSKEPVYEEVTPRQNDSLAWLVENLTRTLHVPMTEIFRHTTVSRKMPSEAESARW